jgi:cytoskeletal protein CcmA (bactofilin family)
MPASQQGKERVTCPHCGHRQLEPHGVYSTNCQACGQHLRIEDLGKLIRQQTDVGSEQRIVTCFECGTPLKVAPTAESTMCKRCSGYVDLKDYRINGAVSKNFRTKGRFLVEVKGYVFNTEAVVGEAVLKGRFLGKLKAERLTIYSGAEIKGSFEAQQLVVPTANHFHWPAPIEVGSAEILGELTAPLRAAATVTIRSSARYFGDLLTQHLVVEEGAVLVGTMRVGVGRASKPQAVSRSA